MDLNNTTFESLVKYFNCLSVNGYCSYSEVDKIITLLAINDLLNTYVFTEKQYRLIQSTLACLFGGSCVVSHPNIIPKHSVISKDMEAFLRISEFSDPRISEDSINRITQ
jgi:hypothetical protein